MPNEIRDDTLVTFIKLNFFARIQSVHKLHNTKPISDKPKYIIVISNVFFNF